LVIFRGVIWTTSSITQICNASESRLVVIPFPFPTRDNLVTDIPNSKVGKAIEGDIRGEKKLFEMEVEGQARSKLRYAPPALGSDAVALHQPFEESGQRSVTLTTTELDTLG